MSRSPHRGPRTEAARLSDLLLAFRQAKAAVASERDGVGIGSFALFEQSLPTRIKRLRRSMRDSAWFDNLQIGHAVVCPRSTSPREKPAHTDVARIAPATPEPLELNVRIQLEPTPDFSTAEVLYLFKFGGFLEALLDDSCVGYRLRHVAREGQMDRFARHVYEHWPSAFARYRDEPIHIASKALSAGDTVAVISTDVSAFFDSIDPSFMLKRAFVDRISAASATTGRSFNKAQYVKATASLLERYRDFRRSRSQITGLEDDGFGVPIGSLVSRLIANCALIGVDRFICSKDHVLVYRRYVDDLVIVCKTPGYKTQDDALLSVFPSFRRESDGESSFKVPDTNARFLLKRSKTRVHELVGPAGREFLTAVRASFSAATSERRALLGDVDKLTTQIEELEIFEDGHENLSRAPRLRDADRYTLRRFVATGVVRGLERYALLLDPGEGARHMRRHVKRLLAVVNTSFEVDDFDFVRSILRVAVLAQDRKLCTQLGSWLEARIVETLDRTTSTKWRGQSVSMRRIKAGVGRYMRRRVQEVIASASPWSTNGSQGKSQRYKEAALLRSADLRHLNRELDFFQHGPSLLDGHTENSDALARQAADLDSEFAQRLRQAEAFLVRCQRLQDAAWTGMSPLQLLLSTQPPTYTDVARRFLGRTERRRLGGNLDDKVNACVDALRGTRYRFMRNANLRASIEGSTVRLAIGTSADAPLLRLALASIPVSMKDFRAAARGKPRNSFARLRLLDRALREARHAKSDARRKGIRTILVLPELSLPRRWLRSIMDFSAREELSVITGLEYRRHGSSVVNQTAGIFQLGYKAAAAVIWTKRNPARHEAEYLRSKLKVKFASFRNISRRLVVQTEGARLGVLICSELLESSALASLAGRVEILVVPAWNDDIGSFDHLTHAAASSLVHAFVGVANNAEASDSRIVAPVSEPRHERDWSRLIQRGESRIVWGDLPVGELRDFHGRSRAKARKKGPKRRYRPLPPDWPNFDPS